MRPRQLVVIANPDSRRVAWLQAALQALSWPAARVVPYLEWLNGRVHLAQCVQANDVIRIESPGQDAVIERLLLLRGTTAEAPAALSPGELNALPFEKGRILAPDQWYAGWRAALTQIEGQLRECPPHQLMNAPRDIALMFDKPACHAHLTQAGLPVAPTLPAVDSFDALFERMKQTGWRRVFVKLAYGSSASGVVAYETDGRRQQATTTVEMMQGVDGLRLYNSRRLRVYRDPREIATLINALCRHRVHVERWLPKAGMQGHSFDVRVVVLAGRACHAVARLSRSPLTNLHLLNLRAAAELVAAHVGEAHWQAALKTCEQAMQCFPESFYAGLDLLFMPNYARHALLEVNAFGDLLTNVYWQARDTYTTELLNLPPFDANA